MTTGAPKAERNRASPLPLCSLGWRHHTRSPGENHTHSRGPRRPCSLYKRPGWSIPWGSSVTGSLLHTSREPGPTGRPPPATLRTVKRPGGWTLAQDHVSVPTTHRHPSLHSLLQTSRAPGGGPGGPMEVAQVGPGWRWRTEALNSHGRGSNPGSDTAATPWASPSGSLSCASSSVKWGEYLHWVVVKGDDQRDAWRGVGAQQR